MDLFAGDTSFDEIAWPPDSCGEWPARRRVAAAPARVPTRRLPGRGFEVNPELLSMARAESQMNFRGRFGHGGRSQRSRRTNAVSGTVPAGAQRSPVRKASRPQVIASLDRQDLLPAITFIFSRAGCDAAVAQCVAAGTLADHRAGTADHRPARRRGRASART